MTKLIAPQPSRWSLRIPAVLATLWLFAGCKPPKYVAYVSAHGDFTAQVPWGWAVVSDSAGADYSDVTFTGPLDPDFFRGVPSLSVRWYRANAPHRLPDASYEMYASADDFLKQLMRDVYGPGSEMWAGSDRELAQALERREIFPKFQRIQVAGRAATYFVAYQTRKAPQNKVYGVVGGDAGDRAVLERHAYVLISMKGGFYALIYPATREGFEKFKPAFFNLVNTLRILKEGPAGPKNSS